MKRFYPDEYLEKVMPGGIVKNGLLYDNLSIKQRYMKALYKAAGREGKALKETINETIAYYAKREEDLGNQALLTTRIENFLVWNKVQEEKETHKGEFYRWLPSDAKNPDPEHQLLDGKIFRVGEGDKEGNMPGERYGCRCGIEWLDVEDMVKEGKTDWLTAQDRANAVTINLNKTNILPPLNPADLEILWVENKRLSFKLKTIQRNSAVHGDMTRGQYEIAIKQAVYLHEYPIFQDAKQKNYWHFIGEPTRRGGSFQDVLIDNSKKKRLEIVHIHKRNRNGTRNLLKKYGIKKSVDLGGPAKA